MIMKKINKGSNTDYGKATIDALKRANAKVTHHPSNRANCPQCMDLWIERENNRPKPGVQYALTGGFGTKSIANGNSWSESEVKETK